MQPTNLQVTRSLEALASAGSDDESMAFGGTTTLLVSPDDLHIRDEVVAELGDDPVIRPDRLEEARQRLAAGDQPSADDLADRMVGRFVCDRLR